MTVHLTQKEADILQQVISKTLEGLVNQKKDLEACAEFFRGQSGENSSDPGETNVIVEGLESDIQLTQELIDECQKDQFGLQSAQVEEKCSEPLVDDDTRRYKLWDD